VTYKYLLAAVSAVALFQSPSFADSCPSPQDIPSVNAERSFTQTRRLEGVSEPLMSKGTVVMSEQDILWAVSVPIDIKTRISPEGVFQSVLGSAEEPLQTSSETNPLVTQTGLIALLRGDFSETENYYNVTENESDSHNWSVSLTPKSEEISPFISTITVTGCENIQVFEVSQLNGDTMKVEFGTS